jgi:hypothetical protein
LAWQIEFEEKFIDRLAEEIEQAPTESEAIKKLEAQLQIAETMLNSVLEGAEKNIMTRDDLLRMAHELVTLAKAEILEQRKAGKKEVAATIEQDEKALLRLADQIEVAIDDTTEIEAMAQRLKEAERNLRAKLRKLEEAESAV